MSERKKEDENGLKCAPSYYTVVTIDELQTKYPSYRKVMTEEMMRERSMSAPGMLRNVWKCWPWGQGPNGDNSADAALEDVEIPTAVTLRGLGTDRLPKVVVCSAKGPQLFSFHLKTRIEELMDVEEQMRVFYQDSESNYSKADCVVGPGLFEGCHYAVFSSRRRRWVRCICNTDVAAITPASVVLVTLVDYACVETVTANRVRPLIKSFATLPAQGYSATLYDCYANRANMPQNICQEFRTKCVNGTFYTQVIAYKATISDVTTLESSFRYPYAVISLITEKHKYITLDYNGSDTVRDIVETDEDNTTTDGSDSSHEDDDGN